MTAAEHERYQEDVGAYLLGALSDSEQHDFAQHLDTCHVCQDELDRLKGAADALPRAVEQYEPPPALKIALMEQVYAEAEPAMVPRRSLAERLGIDRFLAGLTPQLAGAAAAIVLAIGVVGGYAISNTGGSGDAGGSRTVAASVDTNRVGKGSAQLVLQKDGSGGQLHLTAMPQPRTGQIYQVWLNRGKQIEPGPLFSVDSNGNGVAAVPGSLDGVKRVMVTRERASGALQPTEAPVVTADL
jgi:anti-sigma-K factor RskA